MPYAFNLYFDPSSEDTLRAVWRELAQTNIAPYMFLAGARPHFTVAAYETIDVAHSEGQLQTLAAITAPFSVTLTHLGVFPTTKVVFAAPTVTTALLEFHGDVHRLFKDMGREPVAYYLPGQWVPHCTLGLELEQRLIPQAVAISQRLNLPMAVQVEAIGLIQTHPAQELFTYPLGG